MWNQVRDAIMTVGYIGGWCLKYVQDAYKTDHPYPSATAAWNAEPNKHTDRPPLGITVPVYLSLGNEPNGHVAIRLSDGYVASSTQPGTHSAPYYHKSLDDLISVYGKYNGGATYLGWGEHVGTVQVVQYVNPNATREQVIQAYIDILERDPTNVDEGGISHYQNYLVDVVRQNLLDSDERKALLAHKQAQADAAVAAQAAADAKAKADADAAEAKAQADAAAAAKAEADTKAREEALAQQEAAHAVAAHPVHPQTQNPTLYDWIATIVKVVINWLKQWRKS